MKSVVIAGSGIIGLLCARKLVKDGHSVTVLDPLKTGSEASWAGGGILSPLYPTRYPALLPLVQASAGLYGTLATELWGETRVDIELIRSGLLVLDQNQSDAEDATSEELTAGDLRVVEPKLLASVANVRLYGSIGQVRNPRLLRALREWLVKNGTKFVAGHRLAEIRCSESRISGISTDQHQNFEAEACVVAAGAWSGRLLENFGLKLDIEPVQGQMIIIKGPVETLRHIVVQDYRYLIPRKDGRILVGSTLENVGFAAHPTRQVREDLHKFAINLVPSLVGYPIEHHWAGLRPGTPDGIPYIGEHPELPGLFVCAGHHRNGFATGPGSAELIGDLVAGRRPSIDPDSFKFDRGPREQNGP